ncbi:MAG: hypothetical protein HFF29_02820 [Oscillospiraceae bacterium]|nr:hypothetical protein [Oscillospiraceae bacterium]
MKMKNWLRRAAAGYRVAGLTKDVQFTLENTSFDQILQNWNINSGKVNWQGLARVLYEKALVMEQGGPTPWELVKRVNTNSFTDYGRDHLRYTISDLRPGLYLVFGDNYKEFITGTGSNQTKTVVTTTPYLVCLPNWELKPGSSGEYWWNPTVVSDVKMVVESTGKMSIQVVKKWEANGYPIPDYVTVELVGYRGSEVIRKVAVLSWASGWTAIFTDLDNTYHWVVREVDVPEGWYCYGPYESPDKYNLVIENYHPPGGGDGSSAPPSYPVNPSPRPSHPVNPSPRPSDFELEDTDPPLGNITPPPRGSAPLEEIELDDPDVPLGDLPQTGMLWWPVPVLAIAGLMLIVIGIVRRRTGGWYDE